MSESNLHVLAANNTAMAAALTDVNNKLAPLARLLGPFGLGHMKEVEASLKLAIEQAHANAEMALNLIGDRPAPPAIAPRPDGSQGQQGAWADVNRQQNARIPQQPQPGQPQGLDRPPQRDGQMRNSGFEGELAAEKQAQAGRVAAARANQANLGR